MRSHVIRRQAVVAAVVWSAIMAAVASYEVYEHRQSFDGMALSHARISFERDLLYRRWAAMHGGVYVPVTGTTPPNPYLNDIPERDIQTPSGRNLTLMNPAYMTRQVYELATQKDGVRGHITSLNPLRPENKPDAWETVALQSFEKGGSEYSSVELINGSRFMRMMRPVTAEASCLKCHASQGYRLGDIRGGISVAVPMAPYDQAFRSTVLDEFMIYGIIWAVGCGMLLAGARRIDRDTSALAESEQKFRALYERAPLVYMSLDVDGCIVDVNQAWVDTFEYARDETVGKEFRNFLSPRSAILWKHTLDNLGGELELHAVEFELRTKKGEVVTALLECRRTPLPDAGGHLNHCILTDLTERKRMEEALRESSERYRLLVELSPDMVAIHMDGKFVFINRGGLRLFGAKRSEEMLGRRVIDFVHADYHEVVRGRIRDIIDQEQIAPVIEERFIRLDGTTVYVEVAAIPFRYHGEKAVFVLARDISGRKETERALRENERRFRHLFETMREGFALHEIICDDAGRPVDYRFLEVNPSFERMTGIPAAAVIGRRVKEALPGIEAFWIETYGKVALTGEPQHFEHYSRELDRHFEVASFCPEKGRFAVVFSDITDRKRLEERVIQSQKMEAVGLLAGGIAHDFNNILSAIIGYANILQMKMRGDDPLLPNLEQILTAAEKAATLTRGLLAFSRKEISNPQPLDLNEIIRKIEKLLVRVIGEDIEFRVECAEEPLVIEADAGQIEQILLNLATNARDAMPDGGVLRIATARAAEAAAGTDDVCGDHECALIEVSDTGSGMDPKTRERIFEPFFTTKEMGRGTGLGLSTVYGNVMQNKGHIECESELGKGTTFRIWFSLVRDATVMHLAEEVTPSVCGGSELILVVEDDEALRKLASSVLGEYGYRVVTASDGEEALSRFRNAGETFDLVILDVVMPRMNGREVFEAIRGIDPGVKVLFVSGYTADILERKGLSDMDVPLIIKPISPVMLLRKVREMLDSRTAPQS